MEVTMNIHNPRKCKICNIAANVPLDGKYHCPNCLVNQHVSEMKSIPSTFNCIQDWNNQNEDIINAWYKFTRIINMIVKGDKGWKRQLWKQHSNA